jgi:hypothetical protein
MTAEDPQPAAEVHTAFAVIECSIPGELTIAEWRQRRCPPRPHHFYRLRSFLRALSGQA